MKQKIKKQKLRKITKKKQEYKNKNICKTNKLCTIKSKYVKTKCD